MGKVGALRQMLSDKCKAVDGGWWMVDGEQVNGGWWMVDR